MLATPPAPPPIHCQASENATGFTYIVVSGPVEQLDAGLIGVTAPWAIEARASDKGVGFARLKGPLTLPYKSIGALIFELQRRQLAVSFYVNPPICGMEDR